MEITNELLIESFSYQYSGEALTCRMDDQEKLNEILEFCKDIDEVACYDQDLLSTEVEAGICLYEIIYGIKTGKSMDGTVFLQEMLKKTCATDPNHKRELYFEFSYEQEIGGNIQEKKKWVECQPHFKLIRDDSDLRVYFQWKDDDVGNGEKVLIGRVGRHPWRKH